ncbi:hypothetical protein HanOQP8_Chr01g0019361 [Helianthus annuus]|nr:hypothetical protein HanOQP8_Chr01g0019361 [Helianthus annuus]
MDRGFIKLPIITSSMIYTTVMSPESYYHYLQALHLQLSLMSYLSSEYPIRVCPPSSGFKTMEMGSSTTSTVYIQSTPAPPPFYTLSSLNTHWPHKISEICGFYDIRHSSSCMAFATVNMDITSSGFKLRKDCAICPKLCLHLSIRSVIYMDDVLLLESGEQGLAFCEDKCWFQWAEADKLGIVERSNIVSHSLDLA